MYIFCLYEVSYITPIHTRILFSLYLILHLVHDLADGLGAREEDEVPPLGQQRCVEVWWYGRCERGIFIYIIYVNIHDIYIHIYITQSYPC